MAMAVEAAEQGGQVEVEFEIRTRRGDLRVGCVCKVAEIDSGQATGTPGLDLEVISADEGDQPGILESYVRWLHFRFIAED